MNTTEAANLQQYIEKLESSSIDFVKLNKENNILMQKESSKIGNNALTQIFTDILKYREERIKHKCDLGEFSVKLNAELYEMITLADQKNLKNNIDSTLISLKAPVSPSWEQVLNKTKHGLITYGTYQIIGDNHFLIFTGDFRNKPDYILRYDVKEFVKSAKPFISSFENYFI